MKFKSLLIITIILLSGCNKKADEADAFGSFEATEIIVSSETSGRILYFATSEGSTVKGGSMIAIIDTTLFHLQKAEIIAGMRGVRSRIGSIDAQNEILYQQLENLNVNISRIKNMLEDDAATVKQYDDLKGEEAILHKQIAANNTQKASVMAELSVFESRLATMDEQISRSYVKSPLSGIVTEKYTDEGEVTAAGRPLVKIADLSVMRLKAYISGSQLVNIRTGQLCTVRTDEGEKGYRVYEGIVSYISGQAEFTPKIIQTKEERVTLVYAVYIDVPNDGSLKSGMPGEALLGNTND